MSEKSTKPAIRFEGFDDDWEQRKIGDFIKDTGSRTSDFNQFPLYSLTIESGVTPKTQRYERSFLVTKEDDLFKIVEPGNFVTNPMNLRFGAVGYNKESHSVSVSGYYDVFEIDNNQCSNFWNAYFRTASGLQKFDDAATGSLIEKRRVHYSELKKIDFFVPKSRDERISIGSFMEQLDNLITLHQRKYNKLLTVKKSMLEKMFPKDGAHVPEIRFDGFTGPWEQRKLGDFTGKVTERNAGMSVTEAFTNSAEFGVISQLDFFDHAVSKDESISGYTIVRPEDFVYNPRISVTAPVGPINRNRLNRAGVMSPLYTVFRTDESIDRVYLEHFFKTSGWHSYMQLNGNSGARSDRFSIGDDTFFAMPIPAPSLTEQRRLAAFLEGLDALITLHQRKLDKLKKIKAAMLEKLFV